MPAASTSSTTGRSDAGSTAANIVLPQELVALVQGLLRMRGGLESQIPQLSASKTLTLQQQLAADCRSYLTRMRRDVEELKLQVDDLTKSRERTAAAAHLNEIEGSLAEITQSYREAIITSKKTIDKSTTSARDLLLQTSGKERRAAKAEASGEDALMNATSEVTEGLRRTMGLLQQSLDSSLVNTETLEQQTLTMQMTSDEYSTFSTLLTTSKALITSLQRADVLDRALLLGAFLFFLLCCIWIVKRRIVDKGIRVAGALGRAASRGSSGKQALRRSVTDLVEEATAAATRLASVITSTAIAVASRASTTPVHVSQPVQSSKRTRRRQPEPSKVSSIVSPPDEPVLAEPVATPSPSEMSREISSSAPAALAPAQPVTTTSVIEPDTTPSESFETATIPSAASPTTSLHTDVKLDPLTTETESSLEEPISTPSPSTSSSIPAEELVDEVVELGLDPLDDGRDSIDPDVGSTIIDEPEEDEVLDVAPALPLDEPILEQDDDGQGSEEDIDRPQGQDDVARDVPLVSEDLSGLEGDSVSSFQDSEESHSHVRDEL